MRTARTRLTTAPALAVMGLAVAAAAFAQPAVAGGATGDAAPPGTTIVMSPDTPGQPLSPQLFGANNNYAADGSGMFDAAQNRVYPSFVHDVRQTGFTAMRFPGGTMANTYHFERAIGPESQRTANVNGVLGHNEPLDNNFGLDEYGRFLDQTGMTGNLMLNFGTGTAAEAADFVEYMTAPVGTNPRGGVAWADVRTRNGHPAPYNIDLVEVGNELSNADQHYWMDGTATTSCQVAVDCLYAQGGTTRWTNQDVVEPADWRASASVSTGAENQVFYARFTPVIVATAAVSVDGVTWSPVSDLGAQPAAAEDYTINEDGTIHFGDGVHGAIPPKGSKITVTYSTGRHGGFSDFYSAIKEVDPNIKVCSSIGTQEFLDLMGTTHPYDCVVQHVYSTGPSTALGAADYHDGMMLTAQSLGQKTADLRQRIDSAAGERAKDVGIVVTEYGHLGSGFPTGTEHYHLSLDEGLYVADLIREFANQGVPLAEKAKLTDYVWSAAPSSSQSVGFPENAMIAGPAPHAVLTPTAQIVQLMSSMTGSEVVSSSVSGNPSRVTYTGQSLDALETLASRDSSGHLYLIVINQDATDDVSATIDTGSFTHRPAAQVAEVDGTSFLSYNSPSDEHAVTFRRGARQVGSGAFTYTFRSHSVTGFRLTDATS